MDGATDEKRHLTELGMIIRDSRIVVQLSSYCNKPFACQPATAEALALQVAMTISKEADFAQGSF